MENKEQILLRMKEDILLRGLSVNTLESYTLNARTFLEYCNRPAEQLNEHHAKTKKSLGGTFFVTLSLNET